MNSKLIANGILRALAISIGVTLLLFFIYKIQSVILYVFVAAVISLVGRPIVWFFKKKLKFHPTLAVVIAMFLFVGIIIGLIGLFVPLIANQGKNLALLDIDLLQSNIESLYHQMIVYFDVKNIDIEQSIKNSEWLSGIEFSFIPEILNNFLGVLGSFSVGLFSVLFISFFFLKDSQMFENGILIFVPDNKIGRTQRSFAIIKDLLSRYFVGLIFQILILFVIYTIVLLIFGIENPLVIAFLCALLNLIPYVGPLISGCLMLLLTMSSNLGNSFSEVILPKTLYVMMGFLVGQLVDNFFTQPVIFSKSVKSHPLEIFLIIMISGILFGIIGMVVAVPGYTVIKVILKEFLSDNNIVKKLTKHI